MDQLDYKLLFGILAFSFILIMLVALIFPPSISIAILLVYIALIARIVYEILS